MALEMVLSHLMARLMERERSLCSIYGMARIEGQENSLRFYSGVHSHVCFTAADNDQTLAAILGNLNRLMQRGAAEQIDAAQRQRDERKVRA